MLKVRLSGIERPLFWLSLGSLLFTGILLGLLLLFLVVYGEHLHKLLIPVMGYSIAFFCILLGIGGMLGKKSILKFIPSIWIHNQLKMYKRAIKHTDEKQAYLIMSKKIGMIAVFLGLFVLVLTQILY